jgi:hypothetical protein
MLCLSLLALGLALPAWAQTGAYSLNGGTANLPSLTESTSTADQSGILVYNSGNLTVGTVNVTTSGNASSTDNSDKYGINAGILAGTSSTKGTIAITGSSNSVVTTGSIANGLFATYSGSSVTMLGGTITASGANAHGVDATYGGAVTLSNVNVTTYGADSSAIATLRWWHGECHRRDDLCLQHDRWRPFGGHLFDRHHYGQRCQGYVHGRLRRGD